MPYLCRMETPAVIRIDTKTGRSAILPRPEPYWHKHARDRHLGYRKAADGSGSWIARYRYPNGEAPPDSAARPLKALGEHTDAFGFDQAMAAAIAWFRELDSGVRAEAETVADIARLYVEDRGKQKGEATKLDYLRAFERSVFGGGGKSLDKHAPNAIGAVQLAKFRSRHLEAWRDALVLGGMSKATANRMRTRLIAALNFAVRKKYISADAAQEWRNVEAFKGANKRRDLFLDLKQRRALLKAAEGAVRDLIEAVTLTGARAGELVSARRSAFDARVKSITLTGKTGTRVIPLSPAAVVLFERLSKDKLPTAFLLTRDDGRHWAHSDWDKLVRDAASKAALPKGTCLYTLRHSWITAALTDGMSPLVVARIVGTSLPMIDRNYGHLSDASARDHLARVKFS
jgi:integrase